MQTPITVEHTNVHNIHVFAFTGELDKMNADETFVAIEHTLGDFEGKKIIFDFEWLTYLNSKAIGHIADIYSDANGNGGVLTICAAKHVYDTLELVGLPSIISVYETREEALKQAEDNNQPTL